MYKNIHPLSRSVMRSNSQNRIQHILHFVCAPTLHFWVWLKKIDILLICMTWSIVIAIININNFILYYLRGASAIKIGQTLYLRYLCVLRKNILLTFSTRKKKKKYKKEKKLGKHIGRGGLSKMAKMAKVGKPRYRFLYNH